MGPIDFGGDLLFSKEELSQRADAQNGRHFQHLQAQRGHPDV